MVAAAELDDDPAPPVEPPSLEDRLMTFFKKFNPHRLGLVRGAELRNNLVAKLEVRAIAHKYRDDEEGLNEWLMEQYDADLSQVKIRTTSEDPEVKEKRIKWERRRRKAPIIARLSLKQG